MEDHEDGGDRRGAGAGSGADWRRLLEMSLGHPATDGNHVEVLRDGVEIFPSMLDAIRHARSTVDLLTFVYWRGDIARRFAEALGERARAGVRCRVILDALGARHVDTSLIAAMEDAGVLVHWYRPLTGGRRTTRSRTSEAGHRTHRKVLVCDATTGFVGGVGIAEEWDGRSDDATGWRETQLRVRGPVVDGLVAAFLDDWYESEYPLTDGVDRFPVHDATAGSTAMAVRGQAGTDRNDIALLRQLLFDHASERIRAATPYFAPDERVMAALTGAARRGVQVQLIVPGPRNDKELAKLATQYHEDELHDAGIELFHYTQTMLHEKVITVDRQIAVVGSANLNHRSLRIDGEIDLVIFDPAIVARLDRDYDTDLAASECIPAQAEDRAERTLQTPLRWLLAPFERWS